MRIISFDVFDTLITRLVEKPRDVFSAVERRALKEGLLEASGFAKARIDAESEAIKQGGSAALTHESIYAVLAQRFGGELARLLQTYELEAEMDLIVPLIYGVANYDFQVANNDIVVLISDMYLPQDFISQLLLKCGISGYDRIYVSSEYGKSKRDGSLFLQVLEDYEATCDCLIHFGDSFEADFLVPQKLGIQAILMVDGKETRLANALASKAKKSILPAGKSSLSATSVAYASTELEQVGFEVLGPLLYTFTQWLHECRIDYGLDKLFFLSRDGYLMKKAYDLLYPGFSTEYIFASRRSWTVPLFWMDSSLENVLKLANMGREVSIEEFLMRVGMSSELADAYIRESSYAVGERINLESAGNNLQFMDFYRGVQSWIDDNSRKEFDECCAYVKQFFPARGKTAIVDIGWRGSMQHALLTILEKCGLSVEVTGLYLGVYPDGSWAKQQSMRGFLFDSNSDSSCCIREGVYNALLEAMFIAPHGSACKYSETEHSNGVILFNAEEGVEDETSPLFEIQKGAMKFLRLAKGRRWHLYGLFDKQSSYARLEQLGLRPSLYQAGLLGDCVFAYKECSPLAKPDSLITYLLSPNRLKQDFFTCYWKPAFAIRLLKVPIDYSKPLLAAKEILGRKQQR